MHSIDRQSRFLARPSGLDSFIPNHAEEHMYRACIEKVFTADTKAQVWDIDKPGKQAEVLDDAALRVRLKEYVL